MTTDLVWRTEKRKISELVPHQNNPRKMSEKQVADLTASIEKFNLVELPAIDTENTIIAGHQRLHVMQLLGRGEEEVEVRVPNRALTAEERDSYLIISNKVTGDFDFNLLANFDEALLLSSGFTGGEIARGFFLAGNEINRPLTDDYIVPPFSVFDAKQGYWQDRKREWIKRIGDSGTGRDSQLIGEGLKALADQLGSGNLTGTSIFDPVLCEVLYTWYVDKGGLVIDPFAGGNVRGAVAGLLGYKYIGTDLNAEQILANKKTDEIVKSGATWHKEDGLNLNTLVETGMADFLLTCPPYYDLEQYSEDPADISNAGTYEDFRKVYAEILARTFPLLKPGAFATIVVGNVRGANGYYHDLVGDTVKAMEAAGFRFYNEIILATAIATAIATATLRARRTFDGGKKVVKVHQNILTFWKENEEKKVKVSNTIRHLLETGTTAHAHHNVLMFKKPI